MPGCVWFYTARTGATMITPCSPQRTVNGLRSKSRQPMVVLSVGHATASIVLQPCAFSRMPQVRRHVVAHRGQAQTAPYCLRRRVNRNRGLGCRANAAEGTPPRAPVSHALALTCPSALARPLLRRRDAAETPRGGRHASRAKSNPRSSEREQTADRAGARPRILRTVERFDA
jgi:hypothetical protein